MSDAPIKIRDKHVEKLAALVRNHDSSLFNGEDSQDDVVRTLLEQELARLEEQAGLEEEASEKQSELREKLGLSDDEMHVEKAAEATDDVEAKQEQLRQNMLGDDSTAPGF